MFLYHYTTKNLKIGSTIISHQNNTKTHHLVWPIYNEVCIEINNRELFESYGYAYIEPKTHYKKFEVSSFNAYIVSSDNYILGNLDYSLFVTMSRLGELTPRDLPLDERLKVRKKLIREKAEKYFTLLDDKDKVEAISNSFKVIEKI